jgi:cellulose synthase/poly-beta-1,6-N-acetylglucosamine synthase-like glycosyltransferase
MLVRLICGAFFAVEATLALSTSYLLALLVAARDAERVSSRSLEDEQATGLRFVVLVPAYNEQIGIQATLESLAMCLYPSDARRIVVIADNCTDGTAACAREADVEVWERNEPARRGKGFALAWALDRLQAQADTFDAVVVVDADCAVSANILGAIDRRLRSGANALQVNYVVANPAASHASALRFGGFALMNTVRFLGKQRLGMSCGLVGTGMAFTKELLAREPWTATGLIEDAEYHMRLVMAGERTEFVSEAWVGSAIPTSLGGSSDQQARWEQGKLQVIRYWCPRLLSAGLARRDIVRMHAGLEWLVPPQSLIAAGSLTSGFVGMLLGSRRLVLLSASTLLAQLTFVLAGLRLVGAPVQVYRSLLIAPALIVRKVALYVKLLGGRGPTSWVRTEREAPSPTATSR